MSVEHFYGTSRRVWRVLEVIWRNTTFTFQSLTQLNGSQVTIFDHRRFPYAQSRWQEATASANQRPVFGSRDLPGPIRSRHERQELPWREGRTVWRIGTVFYLALDCLFFFLSSSSWSPHVNVSIRPSIYLPPSLTLHM